MKQKPKIKQNKTKKLPNKHKTIYQHLELQLPQMQIPRCQQENNNQKNISLLDTNNPTLVEY